MPRRLRFRSAWRCLLVEIQVVCHPLPPLSLSHILSLSGQREHELAMRRLALEEARLKREEEAEERMRQQQQPHGKQ